MIETDSNPNSQKYRYVIKNWIKVLVSDLYKQMLLDNGMREDGG